jgi:arylsulfatase A-like enzyme
MYLKYSRTMRNSNLDRLASEGINFSHAVTPCPVCAPARTSVLIGRLTETTTIRENNDSKTSGLFRYLK